MTAAGAATGGAVTAAVAGSGSRTLAGARGTEREWKSEYPAWLPSTTKKRGHPRGTHPARVRWGLPEVIAVVEGAVEERRTRRRVPDWGARRARAPGP